MHVSAIWRWAATIFCWWNFRTSAPDWLSRACFKSVTSKKSFSFSEDFLFEIGVFDGNLVKLSIWFIISDSIILKIFIFKPRTRPRTSNLQSSTLLYDSLPESQCDGNFNLLLEFFINHLRDQNQKWNRDYFFGIKWYMWLV